MQLVKASCGTQLPSYAHCALVLQDKSGITKGTNITAAGFGMRRVQDRSSQVGELLKANFSLVSYLPNGKAFGTDGDASNACGGDSGGSAYVDFTDKPRYALFTLASFLNQLRKF